jgi:DNA-binding NarL/FixJ family response regulator
MSPSQRPTSRELLVLAAVLSHGSQKDAAFELGITQGTVSNTLTHLYRKLDVDCVTGALLVLGWAKVPDVVETHYSSE